MTVRMDGSAHGMLSSVLLFCLVVGSSRSMFGGVFDRAWFKGETDRDPLTYRSGETMKFRVSIVGLEGTIPIGSYFIDWTRTGDDGLVREGRVSADEGVAEIETRLDRPGFVRIQAALVDCHGSNVVDKAKRKINFSGGAGTDVESLRPHPEPEDFDEYWKGQYARLEKIPIRARLAEVEHPSPKRGKTMRRYAVEIDCAGLRPVTGFLHVPRKAETGVKFPCWLTTHGYTGNAFFKQGEYAFDDTRITLDINAHGMRLPAFGATDDYYKQLLWDIRSHDCEVAFDAKQNADPTTAYFNGMLLRVKRALQYLKTLKEWNGRDLGASGTSQGGLQTVWAAACGEGVTEINCGIPWCCDIYTNGKYRTNPSFKWASGRWYVGWAEGLGYYDAANFAKRIPVTCRTTVKAGLGDYVCPPTGVAKMYNSIPGNKTIIWSQGGGHGYVPPDYPNRDFIRRNGTPGNTGSR